jgi:hypothetical protein
MARPQAFLFLGLIVPLLLFVTAFPSTSAAPATTHADPSANATAGFKSLWRSWYGSATHLLDYVRSTQPATDKDDAVKKTEEKKIVDEILVLAEALRREEFKLEALIEARAALKRQSWTWFLDPNLRVQVDAATLAMNNQRRKVEALFDDISVHWRQLKPLHGVTSRMFLSELVAFLLAPIFSILDFFASALSFGLLFFLLLLGPTALFFGMFAFSLGIALLPMIGAGLVVYWTLEFPWMIIQYNPSAVEFIVAYAPFLLATYWLATSMGRTLRPIRDRAEGRVGPSVATPEGSARRRTNVKID